MGIYPDHLKTATIAPIHWNGDETSIENYRLIALVSIIAKIAKETMLSKLISFTASCNILTPFQNAYTQEKSTTRAIYMAITKITQAMSEKNLVVEVFIDLSKAFDSVDHKILLEKLERMGFRGIVHTVPKSYLTSRMQFVLVNSNGERYQSRWLQNQKGISQGSILGTFLFTLYMNDLPEITQHFISLYADETSIIAKIQNNDTLEGEVTDVLMKTNNWFSENNLKLNIQKTNIIKFTFRNNDTISIRFKDQHITSTNNVNFLGVLLDTALSWKDCKHVLTKKLAGMVYALRTISSEVNVEAALVSSLPSICRKTPWMLTGCSSFRNPPLEGFSI
ncbi:hypothetical protein Trydic_g7138 [Trypoxylus dichotomus]